ncbi:MAG: cytochrome c [Chitinophagales bacterium]|nr:cytochrome c [Chitinophagales bacterium]
MNKLNKLYGFLALGMVVAFTSCQSASGNKTGSEYMPDMAHPVTYEANLFDYYKYNRWGSADDLHKMVQPRKPIEGTIARGMAGNGHEGNVAFRSNGAVPYYYGDTEEERERAMREILNNPYPISEKHLAHGKLLYNIQCGICHGEKGDGNGYLVRDDGGKYPVQPANFMLEDFIASSNGRYYHAIMHGKNLMGSYADKLSYEERWEVIQYIRSLQAASVKLEYNEKENTLNTTDTPLSMVASKKVVEAPAPVMETSEEMNQ